jgi:hypothetical protein
MVGTCRIHVADEKLILNFSRRTGKEEPTSEIQS